VLLTSQRAPPPTVTVPPRYVNCVTLSVPIEFTFIFAVIFEFYDDFHIHMDYVIV
jgi:hypothetical protein